MTHISVVYGSKYGAFIPKNPCSINSSWLQAPPVNNTESLLTYVLDEIYKTNGNLTRLARELERERLALRDERLRLRNSFTLIKSEALFESPDKGAEIGLVETDNPTD